MDTTLALADLTLRGDLDIPRGATGLVVFAHGSGSGRRSPRNQHVAYLLRERGLATLLIDLMTEDEERTDALDATLRCDVEILASRLLGATDWVRDHRLLSRLGVGYFGSSTGAAAALIAAAQRPAQIAAIVSRGGRPDLATDWLTAVRAPTLLIVGSRDEHVLALNRAALPHLAAPTQLAIVPGADHLFTQDGALDEVGRLAGAWFDTYLARPRPVPARPHGDAQP